MYSRVGVFADGIFKNTIIIGNSKRLIHARSLKKCPAVLVQEISYRKNGHVHSHIQRKTIHTGILKVVTYRRATDLLIVRDSYQI